MEIITATTAHIPVIRKIADTTWPVAYAGILSSEQIAYMMDLFYNEHILAQQLSAGHQFFLLSDAGTFTGFAGYQTSYTGNSTRLHKLYVLPGTQGKGYGKQLLDAVKETARNAGQDKLMLNVNRYNKAIEFYKKYGFSIAAEEDINIGNGYFMNDYIMQMPL